MKISDSAKKIILNKILTLKSPVFVVAEVDVPACCSIRKELRPFILEKNELPPAFTYTEYSLNDVDPALNLPLYLQKGYEICWNEGAISSRTTFGDAETMFVDYPHKAEPSNCCG